MDHSIIKHKNNQDFKKSRTNKLIAKEIKRRDHHLPVAFAKIWASTKFLFPFYIWNKPVSPITIKDSVFSSCSSTTLDIFDINSCIFYICNLVSSISFCFDFFSKTSKLASFSRSSSVNALFLETGAGVWYFPFSSCLSIDMVLSRQKTTLEFFSFFSK